ncbi:MAG: thioesterase family protein [Pseudomonadota bacterium]
MSEPSFVTGQRVDWGDCDAAGIVFYPNFYRWMDGHYHVFTAACGFDQRKLLSTYGLLGTPLRQTGCTFVSPTRFGDTLIISSRLKSMTETSLSLAYHFSRSGTTIAEGFEVRVMVRERDGVIEKTDIPDPIRTALADYLVLS